MDKISLGYNAVPSQAKKLVLEVFNSGRFSPGKKVREFEEKFAALHHAKQAVFVNSGTDALRLSLLALKEKYRWPEGSLVVVPALTFVATVNVVLQAGLKPFFVDVGMTDYCLNPWNLDRRVNGEKHGDIVAIMPVHLFGQACDPFVFELAKKYNLKVIEDSCETILNPIQGEASCYSTYMAHHLTTGVGGFALANDQEIHGLIRSYANHGRDGLYVPGYSEFLPEKYQCSGTELLKRRFSFDRVGYSCRGTEFEAALGLSQLKDLAANVQRRKGVFQEIYKALSRFDELKIREIEVVNSAFAFPVVLKEHSSIDKYRLCLHLENAGIETRDMMPITNQRCYRGLVNEAEFPVAEWINKNGFYIPSHPGIAAKEVGRIQSAFAEYLKKGKSHMAGSLAVAA